MWIKQLTLAAGPLGVVKPGDVVEVSDVVGRGLIAAGSAIAVRRQEAGAPAEPEAEPKPVKESGEVETATAEPAQEHATLSRRRGKRKSVKPNGND